MQAVLGIRSSGRVGCRVEAWHLTSRLMTRAGKGPPSMLSQPSTVRVVAPVVSARATSQGRGGTATGRSEGGRGGGRGGKRDTDGQQRLSKIMAEAGVASRRACEELIISGVVKVNGETVTVPQTRFSRQKDKIEVQGRAIRQEPIKKWYFAVNKPKGYSCMARADVEEGKPIALDVFADWLREWKKKHPGQMPPRLQVAGNLDVNATGLLLVTNDGKWAQRVTSLGAGITREYTVSTTPSVAKAGKGVLVKIGQGAVVNEETGTKLVPKLVGTDGSGSDRIRIVVAEGSSRQVRTLIESCGLRVNGMKRVRIGGYRMPRALGFASIRELKPHEVRRVTDRGADGSI